MCMLVREEIFPSDREIVSDVLVSFTSGSGQKWSTTHRRKPIIMV